MHAHAAQVAALNDALDAKEAALASQAQSALEAELAVQQQRAAAAQVCCCCLCVHFTA